MPSVKGKAPSFASSLRSHAKDETDYGQDFTRLPGGISGGVARLTSCAIGTYKTGDNKGKEFFRAAGVVVEPSVAVNTVKTFERGQVKVVSSVEEKVRGRQTSIMIPLCETSKSDGQGGRVAVSADENVQLMLNELRKLGGDDCTAGLDELDESASEADCKEALQGIFDGLEGAGIYFRFGTRSPDPTAAYPNPRTFETWYGSKDVDYHPEEGNGVFEKPQAASAKFEDAAEEADAEVGDHGLDELVEKADEGDEEAGNKLKELAVDAGIAEEDVDGAKNWGAVADMIRESGETAAEEPEAESEELPGSDDVPWEPVKGETTDYKPIDPKTKKPVKRAVSCEIVSVDKKRKTMVLKDLASKKLYKDVKWDAVEQS